MDKFTEVFKMFGAKGQEYTIEQFAKMAFYGGPIRVFTNSKYTVVKRELEAREGWPAMTWLSIKRNDKETIHDWRDLQRIKNMLMGEEHEAVELYPAESRLVDAANQYHLYCLSEKGIRFPFGFQDRLVSGEKEAAAIGAKQRSFEKESA